MKGASMPARAPLRSVPPPTPADSLIVLSEEDGYLVYRSSDPRVTFLVTGDPEKPACTCSGFQSAPEGDCEHIVAVFHETPSRPGALPNFQAARPVASTVKAAATPASAAPSSQAGPSLL